MVEDELAKERVEMKKKITAEENEIIYAAMYRIWSVNQDADISFMGDEQENILAKWKAHFEEEELLASITISEATAMDEDGGEVSLKGAPRDFVAEIGTLIAKEAYEATIA